MTEHIIYFGVLSLHFLLFIGPMNFSSFLTSSLSFSSFSSRAFTDRYRRLTHLFLSPLTVFINVLNSENSFKYKFTLPDALKRKNYLKEYTLTIILDCRSDANNGPLLASANPLFKNILQQVLDVLT